MGIVSSNTLCSTAGLPQGSILGLYYCIVYQRSTIDLFANYGTLHANQWQECIVYRECTLKWPAIGTHQRKQVLNVQIYDHPIENVYTQKILGVHLESTPQITQFVASNLHFLQRIKKNLHLLTRTILEMFLYFRLSFFVKRYCVALLLSHLNCILKIPEPSSGLWYRNWCNLWCTLTTTICET